jgi:hypothetical protein
MTGFCLYAWQSSQQIQRVYLLGRMKLRTDQMQVATGGADMTMAQQLLDGVQINAAFEQMCGKTMAQRMNTANLGNSRP